MSKIQNFMSGREAARKTLNVKKLSLKDVKEKIKENIKNNSNHFKVYVCQIDKKTYRFLKRKGYDLFIDDDTRFYELHICWK